MPGIKLWYQIGLIYYPDFDTPVDSLNANVLTEVIEGAWPTIAGVKTCQCGDIGGVEPNVTSTLK